MKVRFIFLACALAFTITLAVMVGQRLSTEAMAVVVGVLAGVAASIPTSLIVTWLTARATPAPPPPPPPAREAEPRIIIVPPAVSNYPPPSAAAYLSLNAPLPQPRQFTLLGGEEALDHDTAEMRSGL